MTTPKLHRRTALTLTELLIAASLIGTLVTIYLPMLKRVDGLQQNVATRRLAFEELSNQLERLIGIADDELVEQLDHLRLSDELQSRLDGTRLSGELTGHAGGDLIRLRLTWDDESQLPITLSTWKIRTAAAATRNVAVDEGDAS